MKNIQRKPFTERSYASVVQGTADTALVKTKIKVPKEEWVNDSVGSCLVWKTRSSLNLCLVPVTVTLFGNLYSEDVIKLK